MLKTKPLSQLLHQAISPNVSSAFLFTPSGSLLANATSPVAPGAKKARTHAALAANIWSVYSQAASSGVIEQCIRQTDGELSKPQDAPPAPESSSSSQAPASPGNASPTTESSASTITDTPTGPQSEPLESLTLELSEYNLHIQAVGHRILLCLIGPKIITQHPSSNSSLHSDDGGIGPGSLPSRAGTAKSVAARTGTPSSQKSTGTVGSLGILKTQAQALSGYLAKELRGFEPPEGI